MACAHSSRCEASLQNRKSIFIAITFVNRERCNMPFINIAASVLHTHSRETARSPSPPLSVSPSQINISAFETENNNNNKSCKITYSLIYCGYYRMSGEKNTVRNSSQCTKIDRIECEMWFTHKHTHADRSTTKRGSHTYLKWPKAANKRIYFQIN